MGPGFDSFGMAVELHNEVTVYPNRPFSFQIEGEGEKTLERTKDNLIYKACQKAFEWAGQTMPEMAFKTINRIPTTRGLGSSSAAVVGGLSVGFQLTGHDINSPPIKEQLLQLAVSLEGHADNVAPAIYGGFQLIIQRRPDWVTQRVPIPVGVQAVLFIPNKEKQIKTKDGRSLLAASIPRGDAIFNIGRAAMLVNCFATGRLEGLRYAIDDRLHQPQRTQEMPFQQLIDSAIGAGSHGGWLSGSGPTVLAITGGHGLDLKGETMGSYIASQVSEAMAKVAKKEGLDGHVRIVAPTEEGVSLSVVE
jgi:homoserine kinase